MCKHLCHVFYFSYKLLLLYAVAGVVRLSVCAVVAGSSLEGIQQTVDAADELLSLAGQILLTLNVSLLLDLPRHQPLRLLAGATHQFLHLAVQLLHFPNLRARGGGTGE